MRSASKAAIWDIVRMASLTPAERTGIAHEVGSLTVGKRADVLVLSSKLKVTRALVGGVLQPV